MASAAIKSHVSPEEYLALERKAEFKSEYLDGCIYAMAGASKEHNRIAADFLTALNNRLAERHCDVLGSDMRVLIPESGLYTYPDIVVACGESAFLDDETDTLLNPTLIVEVLSPSTERYDRGEKFSHYRRLRSLDQYVLVAQDRVLVEVYSRRDDHWMLKEYDLRDAMLSLASVGCDIPVAEIYRRVDVPEGYVVLPRENAP
jgi:Uma2 family endonuclease